MIKNSVKTNGEISYICRKCNSEKSARWRKENPQKVVAAIKKSINKHIHKQRARLAVKEALKDGRIKKLNCFCGSETSEAHHMDYTKPLEVVWLCRTHHADRHRYEKVIQ